MKKALSGEDVTEADLELIAQARSEDNTHVDQTIRSLQDSLKAGKSLKSQDIDKILAPPSKTERISSDKINYTALVLVIILCIQAVFSFLRIYLFAQVSENAMADIRHDLYRRIITLPITFFEKT